MTDTLPEPDIITGPERLVVAISGRYSIDRRAEIPALWNRYFAGNYRPENAIDGAMFGVSYGVDGAGGFDYGVGVEVPEPPSALPDDTCVLQLSAGLYAVLRQFGPVARLPDHVDWLYQNWLPGSAYRERPGSLFERYPDDNRNGPDGMSYELWAPVQPRG
jgi:AraC family transcriptional regulator